MTIRETMTRNTANGRRGAARREADSTETTRFEFARRHVVKRRKLDDALRKANDDLLNWQYFTKDGELIRQSSYRKFGEKIVRKARTPEEREEFKTLENAVIDAETRLLLHDNDGRNL
jgi:hypothetical protein